MTGTVRRRANGTFELRVVHRLLHKPYYSTHDSDADARSYADRLVAKLNRGEVPPELAPPEPSTPKISSVLAEYRREHRGIAVSDRPLVEHLERTLDVDLGGVTVRWTDDWIHAMQKQRLTPGTIRKRVDSLARAIDWYNRKHQREVLNPLRNLPKGYSRYPSESDLDGFRIDARRDRRLHPGEYECIEQTILGWKRPDRQRPLELSQRDDYLLLFRLLVHTGLRLREAYTLTLLDIEPELKTIRVRKSKTGRPRDVPMTKEVLGWVLESLSGRAREPGATLFRLWDGLPKSLQAVTVRVSGQLKRIFEYSGCQDLTPHDLRHEATCRWMLMKDADGRWLFRPEEVRRITGHQNVQQFERYLSLRGSDLAERLV